MKMKTLLFVVSNRIAQTVERWALMRGAWYLREDEPIFFWAETEQPT